MKKTKGIIAIMILATAALTGIVFLIIFEREIFLKLIIYTALIAAGVFVLGVLLYWIHEAFFGTEEEPKKKGTHLYDFLDGHGLKLYINAVRENKKYWFSATISGYYKHNGTYGYGSTIDESLKTICNNIKGITSVITGITAPDDLHYD